MPITAHENTTISDIIAALHGYKVLMAIKTKFIAPVGKGSIGIRNGGGKSQFWTPS